MYTSTEDGKLMLVDGVYKFVKQEDVSQIYAQTNKTSFEAFKQLLKKQIKSWFDV